MKDIGENMGEILKFWQKHLLGANPKYSKWVGKKNRSHAQLCWQLTSNSNTKKLISPLQQQPWIHNKPQSFLQRWDTLLAAVWHWEEFENLEPIAFSQSREEMASLLLHPAAAKGSAPSISDFKQEKQLCRRRAAPTGYLMNQPSRWLMAKQKRSWESYATFCQHQVVSSCAWLKGVGWGEYQWHEHFSFLFAFWVTKQQRMAGSRVRLSGLWMLQMWLHTNSSSVFLL